MVTDMQGSNVVYSVELPISPRDKTVILEVTVDDEVYNKLQKGSSVNLSISISTDMKDIGLDIEPDNSGR